jgi:hypothetical protein
MIELVGLQGIADFVKKKMNCEAIGFDSMHILPVLRILVEEMLIDIKQAGLDVIGLGRFEIRQLKDHGHNDINNHGQWLVSPGLKQMKLILEEPLRLILIDNLSRRRSFPPPIDPLTS